jgi:hypothetical protein
VTGLVDSGWAAWLPLELIDALEAFGGGAVARRRLRDRLATGPDAIAAERWERFRLVAPSRIDVPMTADGLTEADCAALLAELGLVAGAPPRPVAAESVELVLTLDHDDLLELERLRASRDPGTSTAGPDLPSLGTTFGAGTGRNDPCPCGSGRKFKRCHGA